MLFKERSVSHSASEGKYFLERPFQLRLENAEMSDSGRRLCRYSESTDCK